VFTRRGAYCLELGNIFLSPLPNLDSDILFSLYIILQGTPLATAGRSIQCIDLPSPQMMLGLRNSVKSLFCRYRIVYVVVVVVVVGSH